MLWGNQPRRQHQLLLLLTCCCCSRRDSNATILSVLGCSCSAAAAAANANKIAMRHQTHALETRHALLLLLLHLLLLLLLLHLLLLLLQLTGQQEEEFIKGLSLKEGLPRSKEERHTALGLTPSPSSVGDRSIPTKASYKGMTTETRERQGSPFLD